MWRHMEGVHAGSIFPGFGVWWKPSKSNADLWWKSPCPDLVRGPRRRRLGPTLRRRDAHPAVSFAHLRFSAYVRVAAETSRRPSVPLGRL